jgi:transposase
MADNGRLTVEQKVKFVLFFAETKSVIETQRRFRSHFGTRWAPCKQTIYRLFQQFETNGSVLEKKRQCPASVRTPENIEAVRVALTRSNGKSTRKASAELGISRRSLQINSAFRSSLVPIQNDRKAGFTLGSGSRVSV